MSTENPSAFPRPGTPGTKDGMTLRDWFAGQAIMGQAGSEYGQGRSIARHAYELADRMIAERAKASTATR